MVVIITKDKDEEENANEDEDLEGEAVDLLHDLGGALHLLPLKRQEALG